MIYIVVKLALPAVYTVKTEAKKICTFFFSFLVRQLGTSVSAYTMQINCYFEIFITISSITNHLKYVIYYL